MATLFSYFKKSPAPKKEPRKSVGPKDDTKTKHSDVEKKIVAHEEGEVIWAKLPQFPWWPGMICNEPRSKKILSKKNGDTYVHIQFFGQPPTHDLVEEKLIQPLASRKPDEKSDEDLKNAYTRAVAALKLDPCDRIKTLYACSVSDDEGNVTDENIEDTDEDDDDDNNNKENLNMSKKRSRQNQNRPRKRVKLSIESDDEDEDEDESYTPNNDATNDTDDDYQSEESEEDINTSTVSVKTPQRKDIKRKTSTTTTPNSSFITPAKSSKLNSSISTKTQNTLAKFSSPSVSPAPRDLGETDEQQFTHTKLNFLKDGYRKDKNGKLHTDPNYDSRTLHVPYDYTNSKEVSPGVRQWWELKKDLYDTIIFFKVGKFYELYHMDAVVGVKELGLIYMKGKFAHCGFPEIAFSRYSEVLVQRGYKVARIEQTETPQAMNARGGAKVVRREVCAVISKGTRTFSFMEGQSDGDASNYLLAFTEKEKDMFQDVDVQIQPCDDVNLGGSLFGVCFLDTSIGKFHLGQFKDDRQCSRFLTMISQYPPVQILYERNGCSPKVQHILNHELLAAIKESLAPGSEFWGASKTLKHIHEQRYFDNENKDNEEGEWPKVLKDMLSDGDSLGLEASNDYCLAIKSLGACTWYLSKCCIDQELLSMSQFEEYIPTDNVSQKKIIEASGMPKYMILDGVTLTNLDIVLNTDGTTEGTLLELLDHCSTPFGKRYFKQWLCMPPCSKDAIESRLIQPLLIRDVPQEKGTSQDVDVKIRLNAVEDLMKVSSNTSNIRGIMKTLPDMERIMRRIHSLGSLRRSKDHPDSRAVFYNEETYSKKKIGDLLSALDGFTKAEQIINMLEENMEDFKSPWLKSLLHKTSQNELGKFPDLNESLTFFREKGTSQDVDVKNQHAFNHKKAKESGTIHPKPGVLLEYDTALQDMSRIKDQLDDYLKQQRKRLGCSSISYWGTGKNRYQLEIPESALRSTTPNDYHLKSQKKGFKRFGSSHIDKLNTKLTEAEDRRDDALRDTMRNIFNKFDEKYDLWEKGVRCLATLDCLMSLAHYSNNIDGISCRPEIINPVNSAGEEVQEKVMFEDVDVKVQPFFELLNCRHPCITQESLNGGDFIPNDIVLGRAQDPFTARAPCCVLITGPNMGGKSTLMRQAGVLLIMAQLGCYVPAESCRFTPVDRVFTRLGARDRILHGESTFFVELSETATIFQHATKHSLVLLDELGRGTSTYDGTAIASAVVKDLSDRLQCRTLFSTHYHTLVEEFSQNQNIMLGHMACMVEKYDDDDDDDDDDDPTNENITFLYKFTTGACPKSYGFNAAKLADLPLSIIKCAHDKAKSFEKTTKEVRLFRSLFNGVGDLREKLQRISV